MCGCGTLLKQRKQRTEIQNIIEDISRGRPQRPLFYILQMQGDQQGLRLLDLMLPTKQQAQPDTHSAPTAELPVVDGPGASSTPAPAPAPAPVPTPTLAPAPNHGMPTPTVHEVPSSGEHVLTTDHTSSSTTVPHSEPTPSATEHSTSTKNEDSGAISKSTSNPSLMANQPMPKHPVEPKSSPAKPANTASPAKNVKVPTAPASSAAVNPAPAPVNTRRSLDLERVSSGLSSATTGFFNSIRTMASSSPAKQAPQAGTLKFMGIPTQARTWISNKGVYPLRFQPWDAKQAKSFVDTFNPASPQWDTFRVVVCPTFSLTLIAQLLFRG